LLVGHCVLNAKIEIIDSGLGARLLEAERMDDFDKDQVLQWYTQLEEENDFANFAPV
jgi:hypothetical protein